VAKLLLENGANAEAKDDENQTLLHFAARGGSEAMVNLVLACDLHKPSGVALLSQDRTLYGRSPLHIAAQASYDDIVKLCWKMAQTQTSWIYCRNRQCA
jgi:ankyrin repeat protein